MRLLVTGAGRTGTVFLSQALRRAGVDARHEFAYGLFRHGEGDWVAEVSWMAAPYTPAGPGIYTVHLVRHPLDTIRSRAQRGNLGAWDLQTTRLSDLKGHFAVEWVPKIADGRTKIERAAAQYVGFNRLVQGADEVLRIEDVDVETVERLARVVNGSRSTWREGWELPSKRSNSDGTKLQRPRWADLGKSENAAREQAEEYGYV